MDDDELGGVLRNMQTMRGRLEAERDGLEKKLEKVEKERGRLKAQNAELVVAKEYLEALNATLEAERNADLQANVRLRDQMDAQTTRILRLESNQAATRTGATDGLQQQLTAENDQATRRQLDALQSEYEQATGIAQRALAKLQSWRSADRADGTAVGGSTAVLAAIAQSTDRSESISSDDY